MPKKILILAGDTDGNMGDLAIVTATCEKLRSIEPDIEIAIVTSYAERDCGRLGITPIRRGWRGTIPLIRAARRADLIICGGGGLFQDDDSLIKMPYWAIRLLFIRLLSGPIAGLSIGAGPLDYRSSRLFARLALRQLDPVSVRDPLAKSVLAPLTRTKIDVIPDPAFLLNAVPREHAMSTLRSACVPVGDGPLVGVAVRRWFHKHSSLIPYKYASRLNLFKNRGQQQMSTFIQLAASALDDVVKRVNAHIVFMPTYNVTHEADIEVCRMVASRMEADNSTVLELQDPGLYKSVTGLMSVMLCGRMHPAILAAGQGTPIVGLAYNPKFFGMFSLVGQEERCISIEDFVESSAPERLTRMLIDAISEPSKYRPDTSQVEIRTRRFIEKMVAQGSTAH